MQLKKIVAVAAAIMLAVPASAQFSNGGGRSSSSQDLCKSYNRVEASYINTGLSGHHYEGFMDEDNMSLNGFAVGYIHGFSLSKRLPMFIETGVKFNFGFGSIEGEEEMIPHHDIYYTPKLHFQDINMAVPVNYAYKFGIGDNMAITPYVGLNFKLHLMSRRKVSAEDWDGVNMDDIDTEDFEEDWVNVFSDDEEDGMGDKDYTWNRFQLGWHVGVGFNYNSFYVGLNYGTDFIKAFKYKKSYVNSGNLAVSLGYTF